MEEVEDKWWCGKGSSNRCDVMRLIAPSYYRDLDQLSTLTLIFCPRFHAI